MYGCLRCCNTDVVPSESVVLRAAVAAYLGRYRGQTRLHTESDLRVCLRWCADQDLDPLTAVRVDIERYLLAAGRAPLPALDGLAAGCRW